MMFPGSNQTDPKPLLRGDLVQLVLMSFLLEWSCEDRLTPWFVMAKKYSFGYPIG